MPAASLVIVCEVVALDDDGRPEFNALGRKHTRAVLYAFDLLYLDGVDTRDALLLRRKALLSEQMPATARPSVREVASFADGQRLFAEVERLGLKGVPGASQRPLEAIGNLFRVSRERRKEKQREQQLESRIPRCL